MRHALALALLFLAAFALADDAKPAPSDGALTIVVMDPLAAPLSCPCVKGYAQRDYDKLAEHLELKLGRPVKIAYSESLVSALKSKTDGKADLIIGKHSVVLFDAAKAGLKVQQIASLTGKDGATTQTGLIVVPTGDKAKSVADLAGYRIIFGPKECEEKHAAALALLKSHKVGAPQEIETRGACDEGAVLILELPKDQHGAAVISSYAKPLLEGCGTVKKGDLRVIGETTPVPFVAAFVSEQLDAKLQKAVQTELLALKNEPLLCLALETKAGFKEVEAVPLTAAKKKN
ncbi:MAG: PhnD/SsuA/transferrin family substrate-binding protein [Pirellulaceae bacterium]